MQSPNKLTKFTPDQNPYLVNMAVLLRQLRLGCLESSVGGDRSIAVLVRWREQKRGEAVAMWGGAVQRTSSQRAP